MTLSDYVCSTGPKWREVRELAKENWRDGTFIPLLESAENVDELLTALQLADRMRAGLTPRVPSPR